MKPLLVLITLMICAALTPIGALCQSDIPTTQTITLEDIYNYFFFKDVTVEGVIQKIVRDTVESRELGLTFAPPNKRIMIRVARLRFKVDKVLIGEVHSDVIGIKAMHSDIHGAYRYPYELKEGQRWILGLDYWDNGDYNKKYDVKYTIRECLSRFFIQGDEWIRGCWGAVSLREDEFTRGKLEDLYKAFEELRAKRSIDTLTREADLIVRGKVMGMWQTDSKMSDGTPKEIKQVKLKVEKVYKGELEEDEVKISMINTGFYRPFWRKPIPTMEVGEEWILFLKMADEPGYYPFAGLNGMFKVKGDRLIRSQADDFVLKRSPKSLEREIKLAISNER